MRPWTARPADVANLLNPAFCGRLLVSSVASYEDELNAGMPFPVSLLVLPIVLHAPTRARLPHSTATSMHNWLLESPEARLQLPDNTRRLLPVTREAIAFCIRNEVLQVGDSGALAKGVRRLRLNRPREEEPVPSAEVGECVRRSEFVGRWFAQAGEVSTIYTLWGLRP